MIEHGGEGIARCQAARGVEAADQRGAGGGGKRVNRESTCKQATRETNNVGAAGCSPPNEAGRQEAGVRQPGRQADRQAGSCTFTPSPRAPFSVRASAPTTIRSNVSRVRLIKSRAPRFERGAAGRLYLRRVLRAAAATGGGGTAAVRKPAEIRKRERPRLRIGAVRPVSPV